MNEITARLVLARCWLAEGKLAETQAELHDIAAFLKRSQNQLLRIDFLITAARTQAASGEIVESLETVKTALKESARCGLVGSRLEALLAKGEIEMKANNPSAATIDLAAAQDGLAEAIGYGLIVAKAAKALRDTGKRPRGREPGMAHRRRSTRPNMIRSTTMRNPPGCPEPPAGSPTLFVIVANRRPTLRYATDFHLPNAYPIDAEFTHFCPLRRH